MLQILNAKILADEREQDIRRQLREHAIRLEAQTAAADQAARQAASQARAESADRLCPDCPCRVVAPAR